MVSIRLSLIAAAVPLALLAQGPSPATAPIPPDPLEMVYGGTEIETTPDARGKVEDLLTRARDNYTLSLAGQAYELKVTFTINSGGQTEYDGHWEMEDIFDPKLGGRFTAKGPSGYSITEISIKGAISSDRPGTIPLRLHEARAALFGAIPKTAAVEGGTIRTAAATFHDRQLACALLFPRQNALSTDPGRRWEETEECVDPQTGFLQIHSQVPGHYYAYDYTDGPQFSGHTFPKRVIVTEAGRTVAEISVVSLKALSSVDPELFVPTAAMKSNGPATVMAGAKKVTRSWDPRQFNGPVAVRPVIVFGLVTPAGEVVEAHSLQPSDPNSAAAVEAAKRVVLPPPGGSPPEQHFVFVIENFPVSQ